MCPSALRDTVFQPFRADLGSFSGLGSLELHSLLLCSHEQVADISEVMEGCQMLFNIVRLKPLSCILEIEREIQGLTLRLSKS